jgi:Tol biopolymer transport system component
MTMVLMDNVSLLSQDMFPVRQLTSILTPEGFQPWSPDGKTIVYMYFDMIDGKAVCGSRKISADGGTPIQFTDFATEHPQWSPDGRFIVFDADTGTSIKMMAAEGGSPKKFLSDSIGIYNGGLPCWSPAGSHIAFKSGITFTLWVYNFKTGQAAKIFHQEGINPLPGCWSKDGKYILTALMDRTTRTSTIWKISSDRKERRQITGHHQEFYRFLTLSPDGSLLVYGAIVDGKVGLWIMPAGGGKSLPLAVSPQYHNESPACSPEDKRLASASRLTGRDDLYNLEWDFEKVKTELKLHNQ